MSEFQYYEFLSIDRPLEERELSELRAISTRARITPSSFTNHYDYGTLKACPRDLMRRYFDAHVYVANWMTSIFMLRVPLDAFSQKVADAFAARDVLEFESTKTHWIVSWMLLESEDYERFALDDGVGWMGRLAPLREEVLCGDLRGLYVGWLAALETGLLGKNSKEPMALSGLGEPTGAQRALAEFLEVSPDLLAGAGMGSRPLPDAGASRREAREWIASLPRDEVNSALELMLEGKDWRAAQSLRHRYAHFRHESRTDEDGKRRRTVGELKRSARKALGFRREQEAKDRERREEESRKERARYLERLSGDLPKAWASLEELVNRGSGRGYDEACAKLADIAAAYASIDASRQFGAELERFMRPHHRRKALIERLAKAGLWK